jgi:nicotinamidase-related amidase
MLVPEIEEILQKNPQRTQVILVGMEAHICVLQTCLDLIEKEYDVWVVSDGVTSLSSFERTIGLKRIEKAGGELTSLQTIVFELLKYSSDDSFH